jgi:hypothetical protein
MKVDKNNNKRTNRFKNSVVCQPKFEGKCEGLTCHVYDCTDSCQSAQFTKTTKEIAEYVRCTYRYGGDTRMTIEKLKAPTFPKPQDPLPDASRTAIQIWEKKVDAYGKQEDYFEENMKMVYSLNWGWSTNIMRAKLEFLNIFEAISSMSDALELLKSIKNIVFNFQSQQHKH